MASAQIPFHEVTLCQEKALFCINSYGQVRCKAGQQVHASASSKKAREQWSPKGWGRRTRGREVCRPGMWGGGPLGPRRRKAEAHVRTAMPVCPPEFLKSKCPSVSLPTPSVNRVMLSGSAVSGPKEHLGFHRHRKEHIASRSSRRPGGHHRR